MRTYQVFGSSMALCLLLACNKPHDEAGRNVATPAHDGIAKTDVPVEKTDNPTEREGKTYCTILQNGSYDIQLKDSSGTVIAVLDRVCVNYSEAYLPGNGPRYPAKHTLDSHYTTTVKGSWRSFNKGFAGGMNFKSEFFQQANPTTRLLLTASSNAARFDCNAHVKVVVDGHDDFPDPNGAKILGNAASNGMLHIEYRFSDC